LGLRIADLRYKISEKIEMEISVLRFEISEGGIKISDLISEGRFQISKGRG